jgi:hypothetical protein
VGGQESSSPASCSATWPSKATTSSRAKCTA